MCHLFRVKVSDWARWGTTLFVLWGGSFVLFPGQRDDTVSSLLLHSLLIWPHEAAADSLLDFLSLRYYFQRMKPRSSSSSCWFCSFPITNLSLFVAPCSPLPVRVKLKRLLKNEQFLWNSSSYDVILRHNSSEGEKCRSALCWSVQLYWSNSAVAAEGVRS